MLRHALNRFGDVAQFCDAVGAQTVDISGVANGIVHCRAFAVDELEIKSHGREGKQQIGKDDGGVYVQLFCGRDGDLGCELRGPADFQQRVMAADRLILGHVAASLAQKPDRSDIDGLAEAGAEEALCSGHLGCG